MDKPTLSSVFYANMDFVFGGDEGRPCSTFGDTMSALNTVMLEWRKYRIALNEYRQDEDKRLRCSKAPHAYEQIR